VAALPGATTVTALAAGALHALVATDGGSLMRFGYESRASHSTVFRDIITSTC
jgi:hypothetical protein